MASPQVSSGTLFGASSRQHGLRCSLSAAWSRSPRSSNSSTRLTRMDEASSGLDFEECVREAMDALPTDLRAAMSNVEVVIEDEPPAGQPLLGLYQGVPLTRRTSWYGNVPPDKISIYRAARAALRERSDGATEPDQASRPARDRAPFRHQRRAPARARPLLATAPRRSITGRPTPNGGWAFKPRKAQAEY